MARGRANANVPESYIGIQDKGRSFPNCMRSYLIDACVPLKLRELADTSVRLAVLRRGALFGSDCLKARTRGYFSSYGY